MTEKKTCTRCGESLPRSAFSQDKRRRDGLSCYCRQCQKARYNEHLRARSRRTDLIGQLLRVPLVPHD